MCVGGSGDMIELKLITDSNLTQDSAGKAHHSLEQAFLLKIGGEVTSGRESNT